MISNSNSDTCIIIPARLNSTRFPNKVMWNFQGIPMIEHVYRRAAMALHSKHIYVTSGDSEILSHMHSVGANTIPSKLLHKDGTSRAAEAAKKLRYENVIVLQADEILIDPDHLQQILNSIQEKSIYNFWNLITNLNSESELNDKNVVKCVINKQKEILFIFRNNPFIDSNLNIFKKIMGTIALKRNFLITLSSMPDSPLQLANSIEQLKIIEYGYKIAAIDAQYSYPSINSRFDIQLVHKFIENHEKQKLILGCYVAL